MENELKNKFYRSQYYRKVQDHKIRVLREELAQKKVAEDKLRDQINKENNKNEKLSKENALLEAKLKYSNEMIEILESEKNSAQNFWQWMEKQFVACRNFLNWIEKQWKKCREENDEMRERLIQKEDEVEQLEHLSRCGVCLQVVDGHGRRFFKVMRPCYHTICSTCEPQLQQRKCPFCQRSIRHCKRLY